MSSLACVAAEVNESTSSAFLIAFQQHATAAEFFKPVAEHLRVKMKAVRYSAIQKVQTVVASILLGCLPTPAASTTGWCPTRWQLGNGAWSAFPISPRSTSS